MNFHLRIPVAIAICACVSFAIGAISAVSTSSLHASSSALKTKVVTVPGYSPVEAPVSSRVPLQQSVPSSVSKGTFTPRSAQVSFRRFVHNFLSMLTGVCCWTFCIFFWTFGLCNYCGSSSLRSGVSAH